MNDGGPAFPTVWQPTEKYAGMSLRDWFAGQAIVVQSDYPLFDSARAAELARRAYLLADAMLKAREAQ